MIFCGELFYFPLCTVSHDRLSVELQPQVVDQRLCSSKLPAGRPQHTLLGLGGAGWWWWGWQATEAKEDMTDYHPYMAPGGGCAEPFKTHKDHSM